MKKRNYFELFYLFISILFITTISSCQRNVQGNLPVETSPFSKKKETESFKKIKVVTTILPVYDIARQIGGDLVEVRNLLPPGSNPHTYEPTPNDLKAVASSQVVFKLGLKLDDWMDRITKGAGDKRLIVAAVSDGVETSVFLDSGDHDHGNESTHKHSSADSHIWMDPLRMKKMAENVLRVYREVMPEKKIYSIKFLRIIQKT